jgi:2',3'-cyclic-nucleotide 2'-phosphodiesterase (5'-nucleotidase family)
LKPTRLRLVGINDVYTLDQLPRLASLVQHASTVDPADGLLITVAGDFLAPSLLSSLDGGHGMVDCLNALGVTHVTLGNHEDDLGTDDLLHRLDELHAKVLLTNVGQFSGRSQRSDVVQVGPHRVGLIGVVSGDPSLFHRPPFGGAQLGPTNSAAVEEAERLRAAGCAAVVALTHQRLPADRELADEGSVDLILGGHEHEGYLESNHAAPLIKAPMNAVAAIVAELIIQPSGHVHATVRLQPVADFPPDAAMQTRVEQHLRAVQTLEAQVLFQLGAGRSVSSVGARHAQTSLGALVCSRLRDTLGAEAGLFNGGALRGDLVHHERLTFADFRRELPFESEAVVISLPGTVLREAIHYSRTELAGSGGFLQVDDHTQVDAQHQVTQVDQAPFDPVRSYRVAIPRDLLTGIDHIEPLLAYTLAHPLALPPKTTGIDVKVALLRSFAATPNSAT